MTPFNIALWGFVLLGSILLGFAAIVLWKIFTGDIDISRLISEPSTDPTNPFETQKGSLSRFQFLIFTFVIAGLYTVLCIESGTLIEIPDSVLILLGISGGSFVISKGIGANK